MMIKPDAHVGAGIQLPLEPAKPPVAGFPAFPKTGENQTISNFQTDTAGPLYARPRILQRVFTFLPIQTWNLN
jgi:hypothetical protein